MSALRGLPDCRCGRAMEERKNPEGAVFYFCPACMNRMDSSEVKELPVFDFDDEDSDDEEQEQEQEIALAFAVLTDPLLSGHAVSQKLLTILDSEPERVLPLVLGTKTPTGKPTVSAVLERKRKVAEKKAPKRKSRKPKQRLPSGNRKKALGGFNFYAGAPSGVSGRIDVTHESPISPASEFGHHILPFRELNPLQTQMLDHYRLDQNIVIAASTSAGKTIAAEMVMADGISRGGKAIFLSPLKAVSQEKYDDWTDDIHPWSDFGVSILTGDYDMTARHTQELRRSDVIVMTSEMLDSKTRRMEKEDNDWLQKTAVLVVDEAHLLTMPGRGDALECGLMRFSKQNPHARVVLLSATMPNVDELGSWLTRLNGKPSSVINTTWRPTELETHWVTYAEKGSPYAYQENEQAKRDAAKALLRQHDEDKWIVFVHSKKAGYALRDELRERRESVRFHNADLDRDSRRALERDFKNSDLRIVIATSTLAYGINMPARRVLVLGVHRGITEVDPIDVKQMIGRAGRVGYDPRGDAYVLVPERIGRPGSHQAYIDRFKQIGNVESQINEPGQVAFHLTAEIAECGVRTLADAEEWFSRSFASHQNLPLPKLEQITDKMVRFGILTREGDGFEATMLGRTASWLYYNPFDVADWCSNLRRLNESNLLRKKDAIAWALGNIESGRTDSYIPRSLNQRAEWLKQSLVGLGIPIKTAGGVTAKGLAFHNLLEGRTTKELSALERELKYDADRIVAALGMIDRYVIKGIGREWFDLLKPMLRYGVSWEEAELCRLPGIGPKRAGQLSRRGIRSIEDVMNKKSELIATLGRTLATSAIRGAKGLLKEVRKKG